MIKPTNISPLNTTKTAYFECEHCGVKNEIFFENKLINTDKENDLDYLNKMECPDCGKPLGVQEPEKQDTPFL